MLTIADKIHVGFVWAISSTAVLLNSLLIIAIVSRTPKALHAYSMFLLNNALIDLVSAVASAMGTVRVLNHDGLVIFAFAGPCSMINGDFCRMCHAVHVHLLQQSAIVLLLSFAYRLYIIGDARAFPRAPRPRRVTLACGASLALLAPQLLAIYVEVKSVSLFEAYKLHLQEYPLASFSALGSTTSILLLASDIILSPTVMTLIFFVRRTLLKRITQAQPKEKRQHALIARALTYQMLLPLGVALAALVWALEYSGIWSDQVSQRSIMFLCTIYAALSPFINFVVLPPYRGMFARPKDSGSIVPTFS